MQPPIALTIGFEKLGLAEAAADDDEGGMMPPKSDADRCTIGGGVIDACGRRRRPPPPPWEMWRLWATNGRAQEIERENKYDNCIR